MHHRDIQDAWNKNVKRAAEKWNLALKDFISNVGSKSTLAVKAERTRKVYARMRNGVSGSTTMEMDEGASANSGKGKKNSDRMDVDNPTKHAFSNNPGKKRILAPHTTDGDGDVNMPDGITAAAHSSAGAKLVLASGGGTLATGSPFGSISKHMENVSMKSTGAVVLSKHCMTVDESMQVLRNHGLAGQANAVLSAAVFGS